MKLSHLQAHFFDALLEPSRESPELSSALVGSTALPASQRLEIYQNMFWWRQIDALREDFPKLALLLGPEGFLQLARSAIRNSPSRHPDLSRLGGMLPAFLASQEVSLHRPDAADLARLEWGRSEVFFEASASPKDATCLMLPEETFLSSRLVLVPAFRLLKLSHDAATLWRALENEGNPSALPAPEPRQTWVAIWRPELEVVHAPLPHVEAEALRRALAGETLAELCEAFSSPAQAHAALSSWLDEGWIAAIV